MLRDLTDEEAESGEVVKLALNSFLAGQEVLGSSYLRAEMAAPDLLECLENKIKVLGAS